MLIITSFAILQISSLQVLDSNLPSVQIDVSRTSSYLVSMDSDRIEGRLYALSVKMDGRVDLLVFSKSGLLRCALPKSLRYSRPYFRGQAICIAMQNENGCDEYSVDSQTLSISKGKMFESMFQCSQSLSSVNDKKKYRATKLVVPIGAPGWDKYLTSDSSSELGSALPVTYWPKRTPIISFDGDLGFWSVSPWGVKEFRWDGTGSGSSVLISTPKVNSNWFAIAANRIGKHRAVSCVSFDNGKAQYWTSLIDENGTQEVKPNSVYSEPVARFQ